MVLTPVSSRPRQILALRCCCAHLARPHHVLHTPLHEQSALIWVALSHGLLLPTSSSALATDLNTPLTDMLSVDLPPSPLLLPTAMLTLRTRSFSLPGLRTISVPVERDGGTKLYNGKLLLISNPQELLKVIVRPLSLIVYLVAMLNWLSLI